ncbi:Bifunctional 3-dehydroquinate dehydratase/shikimate dehydrogenase, chloroplastic [Porphyridium purpureum]|uniref:shikimate dehydrogenase (NADP(+)) n=1 Tax=Porphyridium purpureum TaxID=35688 RepID=A0A5J4YMQ6_PORPP|nr:Bifunctional 3-dehydroquinate dehydratase/shikimate dehydrogenase, chloroplastic [Porphyridium purpureum]|eukprot:POR0308..scf249_10
MNGTLACVSVTAATAASCIAEMEQAASLGADVVEIRIDYMFPSPVLFAGELDVAKQVVQYVVGNRPRGTPCIVTNRAAWEGGNSTLSEEDRLALLIHAEAAGAEFVDVELKAIETYLPMRATMDKRAALIVSYHDFQKNLSKDELSEVYARMCRAGADVAKIAMMCESVSQTFDLFDLLAASPPLKTAALGMGPHGQISRILAPKFGAFVSFCSLLSGKESAPGQLAIAELKGMYRFGRLGRESKLYGVIGNAVQHSKSPLVHNAGFDRLGVDACYVPVLIKSDDQLTLKDVVQRGSQYGFRGFSVTIPHKENVMSLMDEMDDVARQIGAMNTVVIRPDGSKKGYNTDWTAAMDAIEQAAGAAGAGSLQGKRVLVIGAGGAGKALAYGAIARGAHSVFITNRTMSRAHQLVSDILPFASTHKCSVAAIDVTDKGSASSSTSTADVDVIINSTSVGMSPNADETPLDASLLRAGMIVFDSVYAPLETRFLREAKNCGCTVVSGLEMFVGQAVLQFILWNPELESHADQLRNLMRNAILSAR